MITGTPLIEGQSFPHFLRFYSSLNVIRFTLLKPCPVSLKLVLVLTAFVQENPSAMGELECFWTQNWIIQLARFWSNIGSSLHLASNLTAINIRVQIKLKLENHCFLETRVQQKKVVNVLLFAIAVVGLLASVPSTGHGLVASLVLMVVVVRRKLAVTRTSGRRGGRLFLLFLQAFLDVLGDALAGDALATLAEVRPEGTFLLLLTERARILGRFGLWFALGHIVSLLLLLLLNLLAAAFGRTVQRVLQCTVGELFIVSVQRVPKGPILDTVAHVVDIHPERKRVEAVSGATEGKPECRYLEPYSTISNTLRLVEWTQTGRARRTWAFCFVLRLHVVKRGLFAVHGEGIALPEALLAYYYQITLFSLSVPWL